MTKRERCPDCRGRGEIELAGTQHTCESCGGKGYTIRTGTNFPVLSAVERESGDFLNVVNAVETPALSLLARGIG